MKSYVVIGGSSGIGEAISKKLADAGNDVYATYYKHPKESSEGIKYEYLNVLDEPFDFEYLPEKIDGFVYCPGSINLKPFHRFSDEEFEEDFKLQVLGAIKIIRYLITNKKFKSSSSIVLFSTIAVQNGFSFHSQVSASKGAIEGLTRTLAAELAPNIRVNAIAPSLTETSLAERLLDTEEKKELQANKNPMKRVGNPNDIASAVIYLLSEASSWVTGQVLHVDGGFSTIK